MTPSYAALFRSPYRALMAAALGATFLGSLDALMVTTALPTAAQDIGGGDLIALTVGATMVTITASLPVAGSVIDRHGASRSFAIACAVFAAANVVGGLAPSMPVVAVSRGLLGVGAGFMFAVPIGIFALYLPEGLRPRAFGINAAMWGVSALLGPALGAALTATAGWRWVFWVNLPMIALVAWAGAVAMRGHADERERVRHPLNLVGPLFLALTVLALLTEAPLAIVPAILFLMHERRTATPLFTPRASSIAANLVALFSGAAFLGGETYLPLALQVGFGAGIGAVGIALVTATLGWTLGSMGAARVGAPLRVQVTTGALLVAVGTAVMSIPAGGPVVPIIGYTVSGLGMGIASPALFEAVLADGEQGREGRSTSSIPLARQVGAGIGTAVAGIAFAATVSQRLVHASEKSGAHVSGILPGTRYSFAAAAVLGALGLLAARGIAGPGRRRRHEEPAPEAQRVAV